MSDVHDDKASAEHIDDKPTATRQHAVPQEGALMPPPDELTSTDAVGWRVGQRESSAGPLTHHRLGLSSSQALCSTGVLGSSSRVRRLSVRRGRADGRRHRLLEFDSASHRYCVSPNASQIAASYGNDASLAFWMHSAWSASLLLVIV